MSKYYLAAIKAVELIKEQPELLEDAKELWARVSKGSGISHNHQIGCRYSSL